MGKGMMQGVKDCFTHWFLIVRSSAVGAIFGLIPGLGGPTVSWICYGHAVQTEKNGNFGKGDIRGVIAPEAGNNSVDAGGYITSLGFGIPTSVTIALILIVFVAVGIQPGPAMLTTQLPLTFSVVWTLTIANVIGGIGALLLAEPIAKMTFWPARVIVPVIAILCLLGAYTANYAMTDFMLFLVFTCLGFFMKQLKWPRAPLLLGLVLGGPMEKYLWLSTARYGLNWLYRPGVIALFVFIIVTAVFLPIWQARQRKAEKKTLKEAGIQEEGGD
jgi:TctA family transporter